VASDARAGGALVNRADTAADPAGRDAVGAGGGAGTVLLPAVHRVGSVTVAVSTDGSSPALARWLRDRVADGLADADVGTLAELVDRTRAALRSAGGDGPPVDWATVLDRVAPLVAVGRVDRARELLAELTGTAIRST
jgi:siroheme synthase (precorrin-2 oxidase/ferrochelatase)